MNERIQGAIEAITTAFEVIVEEFEGLNGRVEELQAILATFPRTDDGVLFEEYVPAPGTTAWCVYRTARNRSARVGLCHRPTAIDILRGCGPREWIVEGSNIECEVLGVHFTREAAEAAAEKGASDGTGP